MNAGLLLLIFGAGALLLMTGGFAMTIPRENLAPDLLARVDAMLETIGEFESGGDYSIVIGGAHFSDFSSHPFAPTGQLIALRPSYLARYDSTAAGKYQINLPTYTDFAARLGISGFSPGEQDALAYAILDSTGAIAELERGDVSMAFNLASRRWASLPGSTSGQPQRTMAAAMDTYQSYLA